MEIVDTVKSISLVLSLTWISADGTIDALKVCRRRTTMRKFLIIFSALLLAACASSKKSTPNQAQIEAKAAQLAAEEKAKAQASAKEVKKTAEQEYSCQVLKDKRVVEFKSTPGRCEIFYTKLGETERVAWAEATPSICTDVFAKIRTNIEEKGFSCAAPAKEVAAQ